jgi:cobalt-zinc-cadmium efflux system outer membrane protein
LFNFFHSKNSAFFRSAIFTTLGLACLASSALAQTASQPPTLRQALDAAWEISSQSRSLDNRRSELAAKEKAAGSWISGEHVAGLAHRTDRLNKNDGFREVEAEIEFPLWNRGVRAATAQVELDLNKRKLLEANALTQDLMRRVKAGENARVDALQTQVLVQQAQAAMAQAEGQLARVQSQWRSLTGLATVAPLEEKLAAMAANEAIAAPISADHPALRQSQAQLSGAQAKLALANADKRDPMSVGLGIARERGSFAASNETTLRVALRIPLGGDNRNAPRQAAARAELDASQADLDALQRQLLAEVAAANAELLAARTVQIAASERLRLSTEVQSLITKSWRLGDSDLPARLRADNEQFQASLSLARAAIDVQRAIANLNQAHGVFP